MMEPGRMAVENANHALCGSRQPRQDLIDSSKINCLSETGKIVKNSRLRPNHYSALMTLSRGRLSLARVASQKRHIRS
jgi:hypothetical protein